MLRIEVESNLWHQIKNISKYIFLYSFNNVSLAKMPQDRNQWSCQYKNDYTTLLIDVYFGHFIV